jgi:hypothetical protein
MQEASTHTTIGLDAIPLLADVVGDDHFVVDYRSARVRYWDLSIACFGRRCGAKLINPRTLVCTSKRRMPIDHRRPGGFVAIACGSDVEDESFMLYFEAGFLELADVLPGLVAGSTRLTARSLR